MLGGVLFWVVGVVPAQEEEKGAVVAARVRAGGRFEQSKWQRGENGALEMHFFADIGGSAPGRFVPLLRPDGDWLDLNNLGALGYLSLVCHGASDLVSMTDAEFHLVALGIGITNVELRQYLAVPAPSFEGPRGRAEMFDRMLAIDLLCRRDCKQAAG